MHFDESDVSELVYKLLLQKSFMIQYIIYMVDQAISLLKH